MPETERTAILQTKADERKEKKMANYGIMRTKKRGRKSVYSLQLEANRTREDHDHGRDFDNSDIDWDKTNENIFLRHCETWNTEITRQIHDAGVRERKNSIVMIDVLYTASPGFFEGKRREEIVKYFKDCLDFHEREYGKSFNAVIHLDEATPHMHVASVPIIEDEKGAHLSAKIIMGGRADYRNRQDRFYDEVAKRYELERGEIRKPAEAKAHTTKREWQIAMQEQRATQAEHRANQAQRRTQEAEAQKERSLRAARKAESRAKEILDQAEAELSILERKIESIECALERLREDERLAERKRHKTFGGEEYIRITPEEANALDAAVAANTSLLETQEYIRNAQARVDELLRRTNIEILLYKEKAQKYAEKSKHQMDDLLKQQRSRTHSRTNHNASRKTHDLKR